MNKPAFWLLCFKDSDRRVYIYERDMPVCLKPSGPFPTDAFVWVKDHAASPIGFPPSTIASIEWIDDEIRDRDSAFADSTNEPEKEEWED